MVPSSTINHHRTLSLERKKKLRTMADNRVDIKRTRSHSNATSASVGSSTGSYRRLNFPEKLVEKKRRVHNLGTTDVDDGTDISPWLANTVASKECCLEIRLRNKKTGEIADPCWGQAGLIRSERLTASPPEEKPKRQAVSVARADKPGIRAYILRCSRFTVIPITCIHNSKMNYKKMVKFGRLKARV